MINLKDLTLEVERAAAETAVFIRKESEHFDISRTESKGLNNFVSYVDKGSEKMLVERLGRILPEAGFLAEEGTVEKKGVKYTWVIDPLDGTTNFLHGLSPYAISIGLMEYDEVVAGVVYEVSGNESFTGWKNGGAYLNGKPIRVSGASALSDSLIATGLPYSEFDRLEPYMNCLSWFCMHTHGIRRLGSASMDLGYVACGRYEVFYEYGLHPWDIAAGTIILREAGGRISDFSGKERDLSGAEIVAAAGGVYDEVLEVIKKFMLR